MKKIRYSPHRKSEKQFKERLLRNVLSSTAVEVGPIRASMKKKLKARKLGNYSLLKIQPTTLFS
jgi:hypothetical protein